MRIELKSGALKLGPNQVMKLIDGAGTTLCVLEGSLWITEENQLRDIVLAPGGCYQIRYPGTTVVNALGSSAAVTLN
jgi:DUF2917 family protein